MQKKIIIFSIATLALSLFGAISGLIVGALLGGNYILESNYAGLQGYESMGLLMAVLGATLVCFIFILLFWERERTGTSIVFASIGCLMGGILLYICVGWISTNILLYGWTFPLIGCLITDLVVRAKKDSKIK